MPVDNRGPDRCSTSLSRGAFIPNDHVHFAAKDGQQCHELFQRLRVVRLVQETVKRKRSANTVVPAGGHPW